MGKGLITEFESDTYTLAELNHHHRSGTLRII